MKKILIPIDGSPLSVKIGEKAVELGKLIDAELIFITVINMPSEDKYAYFGMTVCLLYTSLYRQAMKYEPKNLLMYFPHIFLQNPLLPTEIHEYFPHDFFLQPFRLEAAYLSALYLRLRLL